MLWPAAACRRGKPARAGLVGIRALGLARGGAARARECAQKRPSEGPKWPKLGPLLRPEGAPRRPLRAPGGGRGGTRDSGSDTVSQSIFDI
eukprot:scaffold659_cov329-Prasinococcus_capsulatus_cf.AAC.12